MKKLFAIILAALMMCAVFATAVWADEVEDILYPVAEERVFVEVPTCSDEIGEYYYYESVDTKAYYSFNIEAVEARIEGGGNFEVYDLEGNKLTLSDRFDLDAYPKFLELIDEWVADNTVYDGDVAIIPAVGISGFALYESVVDDGSSAGTASNPNTGVAVAMTPAILAALALIFKKR